MKIFHAAVFFLISLALHQSALAHHGFAAHFYPDRLITIEGTVARLDFVNPHAILYIDSVNDAGEPVQFVCDLQAKTQLLRRGADETLFTVGDPITVVGFAARRNPLGCEFGTAYFEDGSSFTMRSTDEAQTQFALNRPAPLAEGATRSIFGNWIRPDIYSELGGRGPTTGLDSITPAGETAVAAYDPVRDNPVNRCESGSPIRTWGAPGLATSIRQVNSEIIIYHESMDATRRIHMNLDEHPEDFEPTDNGHSIGRIEGETLIINTARFAPGTISGTALNTDQMTLEERLSVEPDTGNLLIEWTINEPVYYAEPIRGSQVLRSTDQDIIRYECVPQDP